MPRSKYILFLLILLLGTYDVLSLEKPVWIVKGAVTDAKNKLPLPFATIKWGEHGEGVVADLQGQFEIHFSIHINQLEISYLGYETQLVKIPGDGVLKVALNPVEGSLKEVVIKPPYEKIRRILNTAIANKDKNNPEKYKWYRCKVYYKMLVDISFPDSVMQQIKDDTSRDTKMFNSVLNNQHLFMSETYSKRTWKKPQQLQEEVLASRVSGFKKSMFTGLVTDILPFHSYDDYLKLNNKDFHNPVSKGYSLYYEFNLEDEILQGTDTLWILSFYPKKRLPGLKGRVYIHSNGYAISNLIARYHDNDLKRTDAIEQQYQIRGIGENPRGYYKMLWFPVQLNYLIDWEKSVNADEKGDGKTKTKKISYTIHMRGNSNIDSVSFNEDKNFRFDKVHTIKMHSKADEIGDSTWRSLRPIALDNKEARTYEFDDSLFQAIHVEKILSYLSKLPEGKIPLSIFDFDLNRIFGYNTYENFRLGLGLQTNEKLINWLSVGGWFGYGFGDKAWKYGAFAEVYADPYKEFVFKLAYDKDLDDPGRIKPGGDLDKNALTMFLFSRVDQVTAFTASVKKKFGYWSAELSGSEEEIIPKYNYIFQYKGINYTNYEAKEISLKLRYAFAERTAPVFGYYHSMGSKYPVVYAKITNGVLGGGGNLYIPYTQALGAIVFHKHINRIGNEHILLEGGKIWSDDALPISKLFAGNGYRFDDYALYTFGGMMTMHPYDYFSDQFISLIWRHDFDWKLYSFSIPRTQYSSAPSFSIGHNILYGTLNNLQEHKLFNFAVPDAAYHETGIMLRNLLRSKYFETYYNTLSFGYYYHWKGNFNPNSNGFFVFGFEVEF